MGEQTADRRKVDNDAAAAQIAEAQNAPRTFAKAVTARHPDTGKYETFEEGAEAPDWAVSTLGSDNFKAPEPEETEEVEPDPVPEGGQFYANNLVGDQLFDAAVPTRAEDTAPVPGEQPGSGGTKGDTRRSSRPKAQASEGESK